MRDNIPVLSSERRDLLDIERADNGADTADILPRLLADDPCGAIPCIEQGNDDNTQGSAFHGVCDTGAAGVPAVSGTAAPPKGAYSLGAGALLCGHLCDDGRIPPELCPRASDDGEGRIDRHSRSVVGDIHSLDGTQAAKKKEQSRYITNVPKRRSFGALYYLINHNL